MQTPARRRKLAQIKASSVKIVCPHSRSLRKSDGYYWMTRELVLENDGRRSDLFLTWEDKGGYQRMFCFESRFGTAVEYKRYSLLAYSTLFRTALQTALGTDVLRQYKATMLCKILRIAKKEGEKVSKGDVMVVVESMKMETAIVATTDGVFEPKVAEGSAVDADVLLCEVL